MKILVTGATGTVGRHLVAQLIEMGHSVRALTRNPTKATFPDGVEVVKGDLMKPETLDPAFEGVTGVHLINFGGDDYAPLQTGSEIVAKALKSGVKRVTILRGGDDKGSLETAVESSSLAWTYLHPVEFMSGILDWADAIRDTGMIRLGFVNRKTAIVHEADIAAVAAVALTEDGHSGKTYWITGGDVLTPVHMTHTLGEALGRDIQLIELTESQAREQWRDQGFPDDVIDFFVWAHGNTPPEGYTVTPTVKQVIGRPPRTFSQWVTEHIDAFR